MRAHRMSGDPILARFPPRCVCLAAAAAVTLMASACTTVKVDMPELAVQVPGQFDSVESGDGARQRRHRAVVAAAG
jgi:hypothetical protein